MTFEEYLACMEVKAQSKEQESLEAKWRKVEAKRKKKPYAADRLWKEAEKFQCIADA